MRSVAGLGIGHYSFLSGGFAWLLPIRPFLLVIAFLKSFNSPPPAKGGPVALDQLRTCPTDDLPQRVQLRCLFQVCSLAILGRRNFRAARNRRVAATGASLSGLHQLHPDADGTCANDCLSCEHSRRRRLLGSGALVARGRCPRAVITGESHRH